MRDFIFRAWDKKYKGMLYCGEKNDKYYCSIVSVRPEYDYPEAVEFVWMQSTGVKDNKGKLVFEGDIVEVSRPNSSLDFIYVVKWNETYSCFGYFDGMIFELKGNGQPYIIRQPKMKVLGNVFESKKAVKKLNAMEGRSYREKELIRSMLSFLQKFTGNVPTE